MKAGICVITLLLAAANLPGYVWVPENSGTTDNIYAVWAANDTVVYAGGANAKLYKRQAAARGLP